MANTAISRALKILDEIEADDPDNMVQNLIGLSEYTAKIGGGVPEIRRFMPNLIEEAAILHTAVHLHLWRSGIAYGWTDSEASFLSALDSVVQVSG